MCLCLRPLKTNGFFSELFTPATLQTHTCTKPETHTRKSTINNSSVALSLKDVTLTFHEGYSRILVHMSRSELTKRNARARTHSDTHDRDSRTRDAHPRKYNTFK